MALLKFIKKGILPENYLPLGTEKKVELKTTINSAFFATHNIVYVTFEKPQNANVKLLDLAGKEIFSQSFGNTNTVNIYCKNIPVKFSCFN